jgi:prephenate dehydratase
VTISVSVLGPSSYSEEAVTWLLDGTDWEMVPCRTIADVFETTQIGRTSHSVIPVENTIEGSVSLHIDWLVHDVNLPIQTEWAFPILLNLLLLPTDDGTKDHSRSLERLKSIRKVISHPVALAQCRRFLMERMPQAEIEPAASTAEGARIVRENNDPTVAAIGPAAAGLRYQLDNVVRSIQDHNNNFTRFTLVGHGQLPALQPENAAYEGSKTTLLLMPNADFPGGLHQLLSAFAWRRLNLTKIESRPTKKELGTYYFYLDIAASMDSVLLQGAIEEIRAIGCQVRIMGSYPSYRYEITTKV